MKVVLQSHGDVEPIPPNACMLAFLVDAAVTATATVSPDTCSRSDGFVDGIVQVRRTLRLSSVAFSGLGAYD